MVWTAWPGCSRHPVHLDKESLQMLCKSLAAFIKSVPTTRGMSAAFSFLFIRSQSELFNSSLITNIRSGSHQFLFSLRRLRRGLVSVWSQSSRRTSQVSRYDWTDIDVPSNPTLISANPHKTQSTNGVIMSPLWTLLQIDLICQVYCSITCHCWSTVCPDRRYLGPEDWVKMTDLCNNILSVFVFDKNSSRSNKSLDLILV